MATLDELFVELGDCVRELIGLLDEADDQYWIPVLRKGLALVDANKLAGATGVLGCYGGEGTFSDLVIGQQWQRADSLRYENLNARLNHLRTKTFEAASVIASRRSW